MSMVKCPTCDSTISRNARSCPHCGEDFVDRSPGFLDVGSWSFFILAILVIWWAWATSGG
ncbi:MAG: hypothetical protein GY899_05405 [Verrucomicrobiaceae bacterium]|nr:hypothetical protein [Verrucomicrobiaceae bacterium]